MIVAIDGPAGAGKSTVARGVAAALGFSYLDSGAMYRCVALATLEDGAHSAAQLAAVIDIELGDRVRLDGRDVTEEIRTPAVAAQASVLAADPAVRSALVARQRTMLGQGDWVAEGRDIGTVVAPDAGVKVYLEASESERAARRAREEGGDPAEVLLDLRRRDARDRGRQSSPLRVAADAIVVDTDGLDPGQVVARIVSLVDRARSEAWARGTAESAASGR